MGSLATYISKLLSVCVCVCVGKNVKQLVSLLLLALPGCVHMCRDVVVKQQKKIRQ